MTESDGQSIDLEKSLEDLEQLVEQLEQGDLTLDASLKLFEKGVGLTRRCQEALREAEQRVEKLLETDGREVLVPLESGADQETSENQLRT